MKIPVKIFLVIACVTLMTSCDWLTRADPATHPDTTIVLPQDSVKSTQPDSIAIADTVATPVAKSIK